MNALINNLRTRKYGIVYTVDYKDLIVLMVKDLIRRGFTVVGQYEQYLKDNYPNKAEVMLFIINNMRNLQYSGSSDVGVVNAAQMEQIQTRLSESASEIVLTTVGVNGK